MRLGAALQLWAGRPVGRTRGLFGNPRAKRELGWRFWPERWSTVGRWLLVVILAAALLTLFSFLLRYPGEGAYRQPLDRVRPWPVVAFLALLVACAVGVWTATRRRWRASWLWVMAGVVLIGGALSVRLMAACGRTTQLEPWYWAVLMFTGEDAGFFGPGDDGFCGATPPGIEAARFIGLGVLLWAVGGLVVRIFAGPMSYWRATMLRRVVVVFGLNDDSVRLIDRLVESTHHARIVVIEPDPDHPMLPRVRAAGALGVVGGIANDDRQKRRLEKIFLRWGKRRVALERCYLMHDNDYVNVTAAEVVRAVLREHECGEVPPRVILRIDDVQHSKDFVRREVLDDAASFVATLGAPQLTARALVERAEALGVQELYVVGDTDLADAVLEEWEIQRSLSALHGRPWMRDVYRDRPPGGDRSRKSAVIYTEEYSAAALRAVEREASETPDGALYLFVQSRDAVGVADVAIMGNLFPYELSVGAFPMPGRQPLNCLEGVPEDSWYRAARALHETYLIAYGGDAWEELAVHEIQKNFRSIWTAVRSPVELLDRTWSETTGTRERPVAHGGAEELTLARAEHEAWRAFDLAHGFRPNEVPKDDPRFGLLKKAFRENWLLVAWEELLGARCGATRRCGQCRLAPGTGTGEQDAAWVGCECWRCRRSVEAVDGSLSSVRMGFAILSALGYRLHEKAAVAGSECVRVEGCAP